MPAPYSDNLYSADSDDEPDALSPTDGYFHASSTSDAASSSHHRHTSSVPIVPNVLVEDPSLPENKAREAEAERLNNEASQEGGWRQSQQPVHSHRRSVEEDHENLRLDRPASAAPSVPGLQTPLFQRQVDAPPAYTPSPTTSSQGYQTFTTSSSTMGLPEEQQRLIPRGPESMGGPAPELAPSPSYLHRVKGYFHETKHYIVHVNLRSRLKRVLGALVIFSIICALIGSLAFESNHKHPDIVDNDPVKDPDMDDSKLIWQPMPACLKNAHEFPKITSMVEMRYNRNLSVVQVIEEDSDKHSGWNPRVWGSVILRTITEGSPGSIDLEVISNHEDLKVTLEFDSDTGLFKMITPRKLNWASNQAPCIQIRATIWVPRQAVLKDLKIETYTLDVDVKEGVVMGVLEGTYIHSYVGALTTPNPAKGEDDVVPYTLDSRHIRISTVSGDIKGWFPLYDLLALSSSSGDIDASVKTKPVNPQDPEPANLVVRTVSGKVTVREPIDRATQAKKPDTKFPPRDYIVKINTASGDIRAEVAVTELGEFTSQSGDLALKLLPVLDSGLLKTGGKKPVLVTDTKSGDTHVTLIEPIWTSLATIGEGIPPQAPPKPHIPGTPDPVVIILDPEVPPPDVFATVSPPALSFLKSKHTSISGKVYLLYPSSWEGILFAQTISGSQNIRGEGLEVSGSGSPYLRHVKGKKGKGFSDMKIETVSGDQDVLIGREPGQK
ncbi:Fc.00g030760.m01.CDS01 [Cosmosporella sp. VM-42]